MTGPIDMLALLRFRSVVARRMGLLFDDGRLDFLGEVLQHRLDRSGRSGAAYLQQLEEAPSPDELGMLASELTVGETYFFRHGEQFRALIERALPERLRAHPSQPPRLLSAGCASGEEAYSLAIAARELGGTAAKALIHAVDINPAALAKAAAGRYSAWSLRDTPEDVRQRWFRQEGRELVLDQSVRGAVRFEAGNLAADDPTLWPPDLYDVIFCRNVLMYFAPEQMRAAVARMAGALAPGGFLFLGHAETLRGVSDAFHLCHTHGTFYYQRKDGPEEKPPADEPEPYRELLQAPIAPAGDNWIEAIRAATERIAALVPLAAAAAPKPEWDVGPALDLLRRERFVDALAHLRHAPDGRRDPDLLLLEAVLLVQSGEIDAAEAAGRRLLQIDDLNAGAHYVLALCREQAGDRAGAADQDRIAAYLDPFFAMPRLHLGLLARRGGDAEAARRELSQAMILLQREEASRVLLFGGGFSRDALLTLCDAALKECGKP